MTDLDRLRELEKAATPRPWRRLGGRVIGNGDADAVVISSQAPEADLDLIPAARNALPLLLDVVEAARRFRVTLQTGDSEGHLFELFDALDALQEREDGS